MKFDVKSMENSLLPQVNHLMSAKPNLLRNLISQTKIFHKIRQRKFFLEIIFINGLTLQKSRLKKTLHIMGISKQSMPIFYLNLKIALWTVFNILNCKICLRKYLKAVETARQKNIPNFIPVV